MFADINTMDIVSGIAKYATPEVLTVVGALFTAWIGWKAASKSMGLVGGFIQKCSFLGLTAAVLFVAGLGSTGVGMGEVVARISDSPSKERDVGITDDNLIKMAEKCNDKELAKVYLAYAQQRDAKNKGRTSTAADTERLAQLVEKATPENREAVVALIKLMQAREERENGQKTATTTSTDAALVSTTLLTTGIDSPPPEKTAKASFSFSPFTRTDPVTGEKNSIFSLQTALGMIFCGLASAACGIVLYRRKSATPSTGSSF